MSQLDSTQNLDTISVAENEVKSSSVDETSTVESSDYSGRSLLDLVEALRAIVNKDPDTVKEEVESLKLHFYKKIKSETENSVNQETTDNVDSESEPQTSVVNIEYENELKNLLNIFKQKKAQKNQEIEKIKEENLSIKKEILEKMKSFTANDSDPSSHITEFKALQQKWKSIGQIPQGSVNEIWKQYNLYQETFWDLIKINNEMREYDFKKNLKLKQQVCEATELLDKEEDIIKAFQKLQTLHDDWHNIGPVAKDLREALWQRFKEASTVINKKHQAHFETLKESEEQNLQLKTALCEQLEAIDITQLQAFKEWDDITKKILDIQNQWKQIGFAPKKHNQKIYERFRTACDGFFGAKGEFYKATKNSMAENIEKKKSLCEKAESLKDSTDWKTTSSLLDSIQKEWKTVGPVPKKYSDELWNRFISACDYFYKQRNENVSDQKTVENENLVKKKAVIEKIKSFVTLDNHAESVSALKALMDEWSEIGHVPFKEKDKVYKEYRAAVDQQFELLNSNKKTRNDSAKSKGKSQFSGEVKPSKERDKLYRKYEQLNSEIATYENNIDFLNAKKSSGLIKEMERKIEELKSERDSLIDKINKIDD